MDDFGRVFFLNEKIYRGISENSIDICKSLLSEPFFIELMQEGLIPKTSITNEIEIPEYPLILEHEKLLNTLQYEWTFSMFQNAALTVLKIQEICLKYGYSLKDAHSMNILFRGNQAVYVDIGSFEKQKTEQSYWSAYNEFLSCFYIPLSLWAQGEFYISRKILESNLYFMRTIPRQDILNSNVIGLTGLRPFYFAFSIRGKLISEKNVFSHKLNSLSRLVNKIASKIIRKPANILTYTAVYKDITRIKEDIQKMSFPEANTLWKNYHIKFYDNDRKILPSSDRFDKIINIIKELDAKDSINSVLDLAGNSGLLSFLIQERTNIPNIILSDYDEAALEQAYIIQSERKTSVDIVLLNFMLAPNNEDSAKRLKSDVVLALAITHHLLLTSKFLISPIFERIKLYSKKYVLIEFMPMGLWSDEHESTEYEVPEWYNFEWFRNEFESHFDLIGWEQLEKNRILFVGKPQIYNC